MKRMTLVVLMVCALLALMVGTAFAEGLGIGSYPNTAETGHTWSDLDGSGGTAYFDGAGNPHMGFTVATHNCTVCHSVHHAVMSGEALLPDTVANACTYCHVLPGTAGYIAIYDGNTANYTDSNDFGHNANGGAQCTACHQVHAAASQMVNANYGTPPAILTDKLLKVDGSGTDMLDSSGNTLSFAGTESNEVAVSYWCTTCHLDGTGAYGYYNAGYNTMTHVMAAPTNAYTSSSGLIGTIANATSEACSSCHNRGEVDVAPALPALPVSSQYNFPHWSDGVRFLTAAATLDATGVPDSSAAATDAHADGVCIQCHRGATLTGSGVGIGF